MRDTAASPACSVVDLPIAAKEVRWLSLVARGPTPRSIALQGEERGGAFQVASADLGGAAAPRDKDPAAMLAAPVRTALLPHLTARPFGVEERAEVERNADRLAIACRPGHRPAGALLRAPDWRLPEGLALSLELAGSGTGKIAVGMADPAAAKAGQPILLGDWAPGADGARAVFSLPRLDRPAELALSLICPEGAAHLTVTRLALDAPAAAPTPERAAWAWLPEEWRQGSIALLAKARRAAFRRLYVSVPVVDGEVAESAGLARFVAAAHGEDVAVWAVDGDPRATLPGERAKLIARAAAFARYNAAAPPAARLAGVQYDIEPYLNRGYALDAAAWQAGYVATIAAAQAAAEMPVEIVVPFWIATDREATLRLLDPLAGRIASVAVMAYRSDALLIQQFAEPTLRWGAAHRTPVRVAVESGPIADDREAYYRPAAAGELWLVPIGKAAALILLDRVAANPTGASFAHVRDATLSGGRISFLGNEQRLFAAVRELEEELRVWPSFAGIAVQGLPPETGAADGGEHNP